MVVTWGQLRVVVVAGVVLFGSPTLRRRLTEWRQVQAKEDSKEDPKA